VIPHGWAEWRALLEVAAICGGGVTAAAAWCLHRLRRPLLALHAQLGTVAERLDTHEAEIVVPAVRALERLELEVRGGFSRSGVQHAELRDQLIEQGSTLSAHAAHLSVLDERTELLVRLVARSDG
jgi:hypothetical protein